jgi:hypothetical protein
MDYENHAELLRACGPKLRDAGQWQTGLAQELGITDRSLRRFVAGAQPVPVGIWRTLLQILQRRQRELDDLAKAIEHAVGADRGV